MSYVYIRSEPGLWTVGFYDPAGKWQAESDHDRSDGAAARVHYLNGGPSEEMDGLAYKKMAMDLNR